MRIAVASNGAAAGVAALLMATGGVRAKTEWMTRGGEIWSENAEEVTTMGTRPIRITRSSITLATLRTRHIRTTAALLSETRMNGGESSRRGASVSVVGDAWGSPVGLAAAAAAVERGRAEEAREGAGDAPARVLHLEEKKRNGKKEKRRQGTSTGSVASEGGAVAIVAGGQRTSRIGGKKMAAVATSLTARNRGASMKLLTKTERMPERAAGIQKTYLHLKRQRTPRKTRLRSMFPRQNTHCLIGH